MGWRLVVELGGAGFLCLVLNAAALTHLVRRRTVCPILTAGGWILAIKAVIWASKIVVGRTPPRSRLEFVFHDGMSYASGHAADAGALLLLAAALATTRGSRGDRLTRWGVPVIAVGVAIATVQLHYHRPSDAIAGWALGVAAGALARQSIRRGAWPTAGTGDETVAMGNLSPELTGPLQLGLAKAVEQPPGSHGHAGQLSPTPSAVSSTSTMVVAANTPWV